MKALRRALANLWGAVRHPLARRRYRSLVVEWVGGVPFLVLPQVFNPALLVTGELLAEALGASEDGDSGGDLDGARVLDMGTGSGVGAVFAARRGARVVAVDINPDAVRCATINAMLNGVEERVETRHGDLMQPMAPGELFDLVLFNPPFYRGRPRTPIDHAWRGEDVLERFAAGVGAVLAPGGRVLVVFSERGEWSAFRRALEEHGLVIESLERQTRLHEVFLTVLLAAGRSEPRRNEAPEEAAPEAGEGTREAPAVR